MSVLQVSAESNAVVHALAAVVLYLHIGAGSVGLLSGTAAVMTKKGSRYHRQAGKIIVLSMFVMSLIGACVAPFLPIPERATTLAGLITFYLVLTGLTTLRRDSDTAGLTDWASFLIALGLLGTAALLLSMAMNSPTGTLDGQPPQSFYLFIVLGILAALGDAVVLVNGGHKGAMRLARHIWRMCAALFIAMGSLFLGQQQLFPKFLQGSIWLLLPEIAVLLVLLYWLTHTAVKALARSRQPNLHLNLLEKKA